MVVVVVVVVGCCHGCRLLSVVGWTLHSIGIVALFFRFLFLISCSTFLIFKLLRVTGAAVFNRAVEMLWVVMGWLSMLSVVGMGQGAWGDEVVGYLCCLCCQLLVGRCIPLASLPFSSVSRSTFLIFKLLRGAGYGCRGF